MVSMKVNKGPLVKKMMIRSLSKIMPMIFFPQLQGLGMPQRIGVVCKLGVISRTVGSKFEWWAVIPSLGYVFEIRNI